MRLKQAILLFAPLIVLIYVAWCLIRPITALSPANFHLTIKPTLTSSTNLTWPTFGQSALAVTGSNLLLSSGPASPLPTASTAKLITALTVLNKYPLKPNQAGPIITLGPSDVNLYNSYLAENGSVAKVASNEKITEYQILEGMLLPSANNLADSLAIWAFGNLSNYKLAAQTYLTKHGLTESQIGPDASGFDPRTTSTAHDLVKIGELAISQPVLAKIVSQPSAILPVAGLVKNVNFLLGTHNITGIKTGNNNQDKGAFISASKILVNNQPTIIITATLGAPNLADALNGSLPLITSAQMNFSQSINLKHGQPVGYFSLPWGEDVAVKADLPFSLSSWNGSQTSLSTKLLKLNQSLANQVVGYLDASTTTPKYNRSLPIALSQNVPAPAVSWRLSHPL